MNNKPLQREKCALLKQLLEDFWQQHHKENEKGENRSSLKRQRESSKIYQELPPQNKKQFFFVVNKIIPANPLVKIPSKNSAFSAWTNS